MKYSRFVTRNIEKHLFLLILGMHIVLTLLSRLLFLTICIFNVNIYPIYRSGCFSVSQHMYGGDRQVLSRLRSLKLSRPSTCLFSIPPTSRSDHYKSGQTDVASATYRTETMPGFVPSPTPPRRHHHHHHHQQQPNPR